MMTHSVKCAKCNLELEGPADPKPEDIVSCPGCGVSDTLENVTSEVGKYVAEKMAESISATISDTFRGDEFIKITSDYRSKGSHRFIVDLDL